MGWSRSCAHRPRPAPSACGPGRSPAWSTSPLTLPRWTRPASTSPVTRASARPPSGPLPATSASPVSSPTTRGCAGAALSRHLGGETLAQLTARYPHWLTPRLASNPDPAALPVDQHQLLACIAPRRLYVASASEDHWADPEGEYLALAAAAPAWNQTLPALEEVWRPGAELRAAALAWHLRDGGHDLTPWDWQPLPAASGWSLSQCLAGSAFAAARDWQVVKPR